MHKQTCSMCNKVLLQLSVGRASGVFHWNVHLLSAWCRGSRCGTPSWWGRCPLAEPRWSCCAPWEPAFCAARSHLGGEAADWSHWSDAAVVWRCGSDRSHTGGPDWPGCPAWALCLLSAGPPPQLLVSFRRPLCLPRIVDLLSCPPHPLTLRFRRRHRRRAPPCRCLLLRAPLPPLHSPHPCHPDRDKSACYCPASCAVRGSLQRGLSDIAVMWSKHGYPMSLTASLDTSCGKQAERGVSSGGATFLCTVIKWKVPYCTHYFIFHLHSSLAWLVYQERKKWLCSCPENCIFSPLFRASWK